MTGKNGRIKPESQIKVIIMNYQDIYNKDYFSGKTSFFYKFGYIDCGVAFDDIFKETTKYRNSGRVLDIGCAYGYLLKRFEKNFDLYGLDVSEYAIEKARKKIPGANLLVRDIEKKLPYPDNYFDIILMIDILEHIRKEKHFEILAEVRRCLKGGGVLYVSTPNKNIIRKTFFKIPDKMEHHIALLTNEELLKLLVKNGLTTVNKYTFSSFFYLPAVKFKNDWGVQTVAVCQKQH